MLPNMVIDIFINGSVMLAETIKETDTGSNRMSDLFS